MQESIKKQSLSYFSHYHESRLDELRIFLENDAWELCPVKSDFVATKLSEFRSLKPSLNNCKTWNSLDSSNLSDSDNSAGIDYLQKYLESGSSPFAIGLDDTMDEDILINNDVRKLINYLRTYIHMYMYTNYMYFLLRVINLHIFLMNLMMTSLMN